MNGFGSDEVFPLPLKCWSGLVIYVIMTFNIIQTRLFLPRVLMMYLLAGLAFLFYIAKFPEVVLPGR